MHERPPGGFGFSQSTPLSRENKEGTYLLKNGIITKSEKDTKMYEVLRKQSWNEIFQSYEYEDNSNLYSTYQISKFFLKTKGSTIASTGKSLIGAVSDPILGTRIRVVG